MLKIEEYGNFLSNKHFFTKDRLNFYLKNRYNFDKNKIDKIVRLVNDFPNCIRLSDNHEQLTEIIPLLNKLSDDIYSTTLKKSYRFNKKKLVKIVYTINDIIDVIELDLYNENDIITYSNLIQTPGYETYVILEFCVEVNGKKYYEGDVFSTHEKIYGNCSEIYILIDKDTFRKLLYVESKGYILNDELNIDYDKSYNEYVLRLTDFAHIGNPYINNSFLFENQNNKVKKD